MPRGALKLTDVNQAVEKQTAILNWQTTLQMSVYDAITSEDVEAIIKAQVEKAKKGDPAAIKFIMDFVVGGNQKLTINQVVTDVETAARIAKR